MSKAGKRLQALKECQIPQVAETDLWRGEVGQVPGVEERAILALARTLNNVNEKRAAIPWERQVEALEYYNANGLNATLEYILSLDPEGLS